MKKFLLLIAVVAALSLTGCQSNTDYKAKGAEMAQQLDELCNKQDAQAALEMDKTINAEIEAIAAKGDTAAMTDFKEAIKDAKRRNTPYISAVKVQNGADKNAVVKELQQEAISGELSMDDLTSSINAINEVAIKTDKGSEE